MKRILPLVVGAAAVVAAVTVARRRGDAPLPDRPKGNWEPDDANTEQ